MLILVRHGRTPANAKRLLQGRSHLSLDEFGQAQAQALGKALGNISAEATRVISSPLPRALQTAQAINNDVEQDAQWIELDYGDWEGRKIVDVPDQTWHDWQADMHFRPPAGETLAEVATRVTAACEALADEAAERDVIVVTHVSPIKAAVCWALGNDELLWRMYLDNASICRIDFRRGQPILRGFNETGHLQGL